MSIVCGRSPRWSARPRAEWWTGEGGRRPSLRWAAARDGRRVRRAAGFAGGASGATGRSLPARRRPRRHPGDLPLQVGPLVVGGNPCVHDAPSCGHLRRQIHPNAPRGRLVCRHGQTAPLPLAPSGDVGDAFPAGPVRQLQRPRIAHICVATILSSAVGYPPGVRPRAAQTAFGRGLEIWKDADGVQALPLGPRMA